MTDHERAIIDAIITREGGYSDRPEDRGGPTKFGITKATLEAWRGRSVQAYEVEALTVSEARDIYAQKYLKAGALDRIKSDHVRAWALDMLVHHGVDGGTRALQRAVGVVPDGVFGEKTEAAINALDKTDTLCRMAAERARKFGSILGNDYQRLKALGLVDDETQFVFVRGWLNRLAEQIEDIA
jgi:lysozyme family protein